MIRVARAKTKVEIISVQPIARDDLHILEGKRQMPTTQTMRDTHHRVARMFAAGLRPMEIASRSGYSYQRIYTLSKDPAFQNLIENYRNMVNESYRETVDDFHETMVEARHGAMRQIKDKLEMAEENGELLPTRELISIVELTADRTGYGKKETKVNINVDFAARLERAVDRKKKLIEGQAMKVVSPPSSPAAEPVTITAPQPLKRRA